MRANATTTPITTTPSMNCKKAAVATPTNLNTSNEKINKEATTRTPTGVSPNKKKQKQKQRQAKFTTTHDSPKHLKEHLNGIYKLAVVSGFKSNVSNYCRLTFGKNHVKYRRRLSPHWYGSGLEEDLLNETPHDSSIINFTIGRYIKKILDKKEKGIVDYSDPGLLGQMLLSFIVL